MKDPIGVFFIGLGIAMGIIIFFMVLTICGYNSPIANQELDLRPFWIWK